VHYLVHKFRHRVKVHGRGAGNPDDNAARDTDRRRIAGCGNVSA
jgi:hypothetical protein